MSDSEVFWGRIDDEPQWLEETGCVTVEYDPRDGHLRLEVFAEDLLAGSLGHDKMRELGVRLFRAVEAFCQEGGSDE